MVPFNWPPLHVGGKAAPALAAGNAVVLKPPETARWRSCGSSSSPGRCCRTTCACGRRRTRCRCRADHPSRCRDDHVHRLDGHRADGRPRRGRPSGPHVDGLGGKNPIVVFADADLDAAAVGAIEGGFVNPGEACTASSRILVQRSVYDAVVARLVEAVPRLRAGGVDPTTHVGPMIRAATRNA